MTFIETVLIDYPKHCSANLSPSLLWSLIQLKDIWHWTIPKARGSFILKLLPFHHRGSRNFADQSNLLKTLFSGYEISRQRNWFRFTIPEVLLLRSSSIYNKYSSLQCQAQSTPIYILHLTLNRALTSVFWTKRKQRKAFWDNLKLSQVTLHPSWTYLEVMQTSFWGHPKIFWGHPEITMRTPWGY